MFCVNRGTISYPVVCAIYMLKMWDNILRKTLWENGNAELHVLVFIQNEWIRKTYQMAVLSFEKGKSKQGYWVSFFWLQILSHELGWNVVLVLAKTFLHWSQRSHLNMNNQGLRCVSYINLKNPCFFIE